MKNENSSFPKKIFLTLFLAFVIILGNGIVSKADTLGNIMGDQAVPKGNHIISYDPKISSNQVQKRSAIVTNYAFYSKILKLDWNYDVYLPAGYNPKSNKKYPVMYLLHGFLNNHGDMWNKMNTQQMLDQARQRTGQPVIAVFVDGFNSWYINSPSGMQMQSAIIHNLMPDVEKNYKVSKKASQTAIGGLSMGGYGAARLALKYPNQFSKVMAYSPAIYRKISNKDSNTLIAFANKNGKGMQKNNRKYYPTRNFKKKAKAVKFYVETSKDDTVVNIKDVSSFVNILKKKGISVKYIQDSGYDHGWSLWDKTFPQGYNWVAQQFYRSDPNNLIATSKGSFKKGDQVTLLASHMAGMKGATATIAGVFDTKLYEINYKPTNGKPEVKDHKWIVGPEIKGNKTNYKVGDHIKITASHMAGMKGASGKIVKVHSGPAYMVNYQPTNGMVEVKNHKWVSQSEMK